jgi:RNA recognition motif-containing protein
MNIYVGNLSYNLTKEDLKTLFSEYGDVSEVNLITDKYSGKSKGFAFVEMPKQSEAEAAIKALNESPIKGRNIKVNQARPRNERPARKSRY